MTTKYEELLKLHSINYRIFMNFRNKSANIFNYFLGGLPTFLGCDNDYIRPTNVKHTSKYMQNLLNPVIEMEPIRDLMFFDDYDDSWNLKILIDINENMNHKILIIPIKTIETETEKYLIGFVDIKDKFEIDYELISEPNHFEQIYNFIYDSIINNSKKSKFKLGFQI